MFLCRLCMHWVLWWGWSLHWKERISWAVCQSAFCCGVFSVWKNVHFILSGNSVAETLRGSNFEMKCRGRRPINFLVSLPPPPPPPPPPTTRSHSVWGSKLPYLFIYLFYFLFLLSLSISLYLSLRFEVKNGLSTLKMCSLFHEAFWCVFSSL